MCSIHVHTFLHFVHSTEHARYHVWIPKALFVYTENRGFVHFSMNRKAISSISYVGSCTRSLQLCTQFLGIDSTHHTNYICPLLYAQQQISWYSWYNSDKSYYVVLYQVWIEQCSPPSIIQRRHSLPVPATLQSPVPAQKKNQVYTESFQGLHALLREGGGREGGKERERERQAIRIRQYPAVWSHGCHLLWDLEDLTQVD